MITHINFDSFHSIIGQFHAKSPDFEKSPWVTPSELFFALTMSRSIQFMKVYQISASKSSSFTFYDDT